MPVPVLARPIHVAQLGAAIRAGFPSPAEDLGAKRMDVLEQLLIHPAASYWLTVRGNSMREYGIWDEFEDKGELMSAMDKLNIKYGKGTVQLASAGLQGDARAFSRKQERRTPAYTTNWEDIPICRA